MEDDIQDLKNRILLSEANRLLDRGKAGLGHIGRKDDLSTDDENGYYNGRVRGVIDDLQTALNRLNHLYIKQTVKTELPEWAKDDPNISASGNSLITGYPMFEP